MVLADTRATADNEEGREKRMKSARKAESEGAAAIADDMVPVAFADATRETQPDIVQRMRAITEANSPRGIASAQRGMAARLDSRDLLGKMDFPVLIIVGSEDKLTPVKDSEALRDAIQGAEFKIIESAGHLSNMERPEEFNAILMDFLKRKVLKAE
jgi:pimeloyl-ACP methyl ester carboxylesterase